MTITKLEIQKYFGNNIYKLLPYFKSKPCKWIEEFLKKENINHDEPWLTLVSLYALFGRQINLNHDPFNHILKNIGLRNPLNLEEIKEVRLEVILPEIVEYRKELQKHLKNGMIHFYPDIINAINDNKKTESSSLEGSTNLDALIKGKRNGKDVAIFIEAKFLSDISKDIKYNPVRDQIIRNIDSGLAYCKKENKEDAEKPAIDLENFYFLLLTPGVFRPIEFGGHPFHVLDNFAADKSRLYCYKMIEYLEPHNLKKALPHRDFNDLVIVSKNIGWITHESLINTAIDFNTMDSSESEMIKKFFVERNLLITQKTI